MKRTILALMGLILALALLAGCAPSAQPGAGQPTSAGPTPEMETPVVEEPTQAPANPAPDLPGTDDLPPAAAAVISTVSMQLGFPMEDIQVISVEEVQWPDACLGVSRPGVVCAQVITPGYRIIVEVDGKQYEYHTNLDGTSLAPVETDRPTVEMMVRMVLADSLRIPTTQVQVVSVEETEWPNSCLGVEIPGLACAEAITPGYKLFLEVDGRQYEYRTDLNGGQTLSATPGLEWTRQGGIAGFDDTLLILQPGDVRAAWSAGASGTGAANLPDIVNAGELAQFNEWLEKFGQVEIVVEDPATADAMTTSLTLHGSGDAQPNAEEQQAMLDFAQKLFTQFSQPGG